MFKNANEVVTDPTVVTFKQRTPSGVETTYVYGTDAEVVRYSAGNFHVDVLLTEGRANGLVHPMAGHRRGAGGAGELGSRGREPVRRPAVGRSNLRHTPAT